MRYAHLYRKRTSGGVEQYLRQLDHGLLSRNQLTVLQMHLVDSSTPEQVEEEAVGRGRIIWIPVAMRKGRSRITDFAGRVRAIWQTTPSRSTRENRHGVRLGERVRELVSHFRYPITIFSHQLCEFLRPGSIDLLSVHWCSYDTPAVVRRAKAARIPVVLMHHFSNARLGSRRIQQVMESAMGVGVISGRDIPEAVQRRCVNLSDAVDAEFFRNDRACPVNAARAKVVLLPARIEPGKGHVDLLQALRILAQHGIECELAFVGAVDSEKLHQELRHAAAAPDIAGHVHFVGEVSQERLRDWYAASEIVVLPSHAEGLGRVLLEAQSMSKPVVAYDTGGIPEVLKEGETGFLVERGNPAALAERIGWLLIRPEEARKMGAQAREFVRNEFSVDMLVARHENFYLDALARAGRA